MSITITTFKCGGCGKYAQASVTCEGVDSGCCEGEVLVRPNS